MIYYENSNKIKLNLDEWPVVVEDITTLFGKEWKYEATENVNANRKKLEWFYRTGVSKKITLQVYADAKAEFDEVLDRLNEITDIDIIEQKPGKLWVGDYYLECYITKLDPKDYDDIFYTVDVDATIEAFTPYWINKSTHTFHSYGITSNYSKRYPGRYPYRYANGLTSNYLINPNYTPSNFQMIIYGPVVNPQVTVGNNTYLVNIVLEEGEYLLIDSRNKTITKFLKNGEKVNAYHNRQKRKEFFEKIHTGRQMVQWTGKFDFDITVIEERSTPKWKAVL